MRRAVFIFLLAALSHPVFAGDDSIDLAHTSLEDLLDMYVTSVAKKGQHLSQAAAAVFVVTPEDIRRSGATTIPEVLRMVPGIEIARVNASEWAITARGIIGRYDNKLLVLIDGRTIYSPLNSYVDWDSQDLVLEDIRRIEVIRGPGASLWGANAVNGVINIITKSARDTAGVLVTSGAGTDTRAEESVRYGGRIGDACYRVFAKYALHAPSGGSLGLQDFDGWYTGQAGFRVDGSAKNGDPYMVQGQISSGVSHDESMAPQPAPPFIATMAEKAHHNGADLMAAWDHFFRDGSDIVFQAYLDRYDRRELLVTDSYRTLDFSLQHHIPFSNRQDILWGAGARFIQVGFSETPYFFGTVPHAGYQLYNAFVQDEILLVPNLWSMTLGVKVEHSDYAGSNLQPTLRLLWTPSRHQSIWASVSHAVRTPSFGELGVNFWLGMAPTADGGTGSFILQANRKLKPEELTAYELGYRIRATRTLSLDMSTFFNRYKRLIAYSSLQPYFDPARNGMVLPLRITNRAAGDTAGFEAALSWSVARNWELAGGVTTLWTDVDSLPYNPDLPAVFSVSGGNAPGRQFLVRSHWNLPHRLELDASAHFVGPLAAQNVGSYTRADIRLGWFFGEHTTFSLAAQNLLAPRHDEFSSLGGFTLAGAIQRSIAAKVVWQF